MTITFNFNTEQLDAIDARLTEELPTREDLLMRLVNAEVERYVAADYDAAVVRVSQAVRSMPYQERLALIAQIEASNEP